LNNYIFYKPNSKTNLVCLKFGLINKIGKIVPVANNGSPQISGSVKNKLFNLTNKPNLSRQIRVPYSANWR
jgi:hypothetical protein